MEEELRFDDINKGMKQISINLPIDIWLLAKKNLIMFKDTLIFGIEFKMAEKDNLQYPHPSNTISEKLIRLQKIIESQGTKIAELEDEIWKINEKELLK